VSDETETHKRIRIGIVKTVIRRSIRDPTDKRDEYDKVRKYIGPVVDGLDPRERSLPCQPLYVNKTVSILDHILNQFTCCTTTYLTALFEKRRLGALTCFP
jgi:hypothetical protein